MMHGRKNIKLLYSMFREQCIA